MRVILAGATGAIGHHLVPQLVAAGHEVLGVTRHAGSLADTAATEIVADLSDRRGFLEALDGIRAQAIIHQAVPQTRPPFRRSEMRAANRLRIEGTSTLVAAARQTGARRLVVASSINGYGYADHGRGWITEDGSFGRLSGGSADAEQRALRSSEQQCWSIDGVCLRFGLLYGAGVDARVSARAAGVLPWVHPRDAAAATVLALTRGGKGVAYNIVDDTPATWREVQTAQVVGAQRPVSAPRWLLKVSDPCAFPLMTRTNMRVSNARARAQLRWEPRFPSYRDGLAAGAT